MPVNVKKITLWRREIANQPGALATVLEPIATAGADLQVAMGYRIPGRESQAVVELAPVEDRKQTSAAEQAGLRPSDIPTLVVQGDNRPGLGYALARELGQAGVNMAFLVALVVGRRYSGVFGFESQEDAAKAAEILRRATAARGARRSSARAMGRAANRLGASRRGTTRRPR
jgi:hypothetical protein